LVGGGNRVPYSTWLHWCACIIVGSGGEVRKEFYAELPVNIKVTGSYHDFGGFATGVAALPRIVTIHNINMTPVKSKATEKNKSIGVYDYDKDIKLTITLVAKTYRYLDQDEISSTRKKKKKKRRRR
ncbi:MAG TPA: hypothetical protein ENJ08_16705, partial [Gammaproteobacteria bacterium]|nr:hypothetical protein [Gammaproteobacteria bacterium]